MAKIDFGGLNGSQGGFMRQLKIKLVCIFLLGMIFIGYAQAKESEEPALISVSGTAEIKVVPDRIHLSVGIEVIRDELEEAKNISESRFKACRNLLKQQGVDDKDIRMDFISFYPSYHSSKIRSEDKDRTFNVHKNFEVVLRDTAQYDDVLSGLLKNGVNHIQVYFRTSELRKHRDEARVIAVKAAKEKAELLARELGVKVGKAYKISENYYGGWWSWSLSGGRYYGYGQNQSQNVSQSAAPDQNAQETEGVSVGMISVRAAVNVSFLIE